MWAPTRRGIAVEVGGGQSYLVGPDNGLLAGAVAMSGGATAAVELTSLDHQLLAPGPTFAGRDVFAPAAAHLCSGVALTDLGTSIDPLSLLPGLVPLSRDEDDTVVAEVLWVDRYGNCQLNVDPADVTPFGPRVQMRWGNDVRTADRATTYEGIPAGQVGLVTDSYGMLAVCLGRRSAAAELAMPVGTEVTLSAPSEDGPVDDVDARQLHLPERPVRPGTTLVLAILLGLILIAGALQLFFSDLIVLACGDLLGAALRPC